MAQPKGLVIKPVEATDIPARRVVKGKDHGPNFFLQPDTGKPDGWLVWSYQKDKWVDVPAAGEFKMLPAQRGKNKGALVEKLTGDAFEVRRQLNEAAKELGIGVAIKVVPALYKSGAKKDEPIPGQLVVKYLGTERKKSKDTEEDEVDE